MFTTIAVNTCCMRFRLSSAVTAMHAVSVGEFADGAFHSGADRLAGLPVRCLLLDADADLQVAEFSREPVHRGRSGHGWHWPLVNRAAISGAAAGEEVGVGAVPALAGLAPGDLPTVEIEVGVVPVEGF
ncbi:hypothetical protein AB0D04_32585 [Streptomyces sp. NPDC048483]|uniref:hypothetical protein n=1 Tax=Streptomyces sp. NPDC048483 TaxID=3154927 RepID=UPI00342E86FE